MKTIQELRDMPRTNQFEWSTLSNEAERFMLSGLNLLAERLEAGQMVFDSQGLADGPFTEKDLREWGGISGPDFRR